MVFSSGTLPLPTRRARGGEAELPRCQTRREARLPFIGRAETLHERMGRGNVRVWRTLESGRSAEWGGIQLRLSYELFVRLGNVRRVGEKVGRPGWETDAKDPDVHPAVSLRMPLSCSR